jgi:predicted glutamine amidotransferase
MCRHLAYLGPAATLRSVIIDPPHGLSRQAWAPRFQRHGTVNADGFGAGRFNFLLTDGEVIAATAAGDSLRHRSGPAVIVASEPGDDDPGWTEVPGGSVVIATPQRVSVAALTTQATQNQNTENGRTAIR